MEIPDTRIEEFIANVVETCLFDLMNRMQRGMVYENFFLTGSGEGVPQTYNKTYDAIEDLAAWLCSTTDLRYAVSFHGGGSAADRAKADVVAQELLTQSRACNLDTEYEEGTKWALVKGKTFIKMGWTADGLKPHLVMPEFMGVWRPDICDLADQEAFVHVNYMTPAQFAMLVGQVSQDPRATMKRAMKRVKTTGAMEPPKSEVLKRILVGGLQPMTAAGDPSSGSHGIVNWLGQPGATFDPRVIGSLIRVDEVWIKDDSRKDESGRKEYSVFLMADSEMLFGKEVRRNLFADMFDKYNKNKITHPDKNNPLAFAQPFIEICPNRQKNYFWGRSEIENVALLQTGISNRMDGINRLLRLQEDPSIWFKSQKVNSDDDVAKFRTPGGWMSDDNPTSGPPTLVAPPIPAGLYESVEQNERMFDVMTGLTDIMQGQSTPSVRSRSQARQMTENAAPRFKKRAIRVERAIQAGGALVLDMLRAKSTETLTAWLKPSDEKPPLEAQPPPFNPVEEGPVAGAVKIEFHIFDLPTNVRVLVDSHSACPAFLNEAQATADRLKQAEAVTPNAYLRMTNPTDPDTLEVELLEAQLAQAKAAKAAAQQKAQTELLIHGKKPN